MRNVFQHWLPPTRRIPPLLWPRLQAEMSSYIVKRESDGSMVYYWYHRQFIKVARDRYLSSESLKTDFHSSIADYFLGKYTVGSKKSFKVPKVAGSSQRFKEIEADRKVRAQPLIFGTDIHRHAKIRYNMRKLSELPYQLIHAGRIEDLKSEVLFNLKWLKTKVAAQTIQDVLSDFRQLQESNYAVDDPEVSLLANTLQLCGTNVQKSAGNTLDFEISARLLPFYDNKKYEYIRRLIRFCDGKREKPSAIVPLFACLEPPNPALRYLLEDHTQHVLDLTFSSNGKYLYSLSKDGTLGKWDMKIGERLFSVPVDKTDKAKASIHLTADDKYVITTAIKEDCETRIFDTKSGSPKGEILRAPNISNLKHVGRRYFIRQKEVINVETGNTLMNLEDFLSNCSSNSLSIYALAMTHDEQLLLLGTKIGTLIFDLQVS